MRTRSAPPRKLEPLAEVAERVVVAIVLERAVGEVDQVAERLVGQIVLARQEQTLFPEGKRLHLSPPRLHEDALLAESTGDDEGSTEGFPDLERELEVLVSPIEVAGEEVAARENRREQADVVVRLVVAHGCERLFRASERLVVAAGCPFDPGEPAGHARGGVRVARGLVDGRRLTQEPLGDVVVRGVHGEPAGPIEESAALTEVVRQRGGPFNVLGGFACSRERFGSRRGAKERAGCLVSYRDRIGRVGDRLGRGQVVRREHLGDLVLGGKRALQVLGRGEVASPALAFRQRLVGDMAHEVLQEPVLPLLGRAWVGLQREDLLAHEPGEQRAELVLADPRDRGQPLRA